MCRCVHACVHVHFDYPRVTARLEAVQGRNPCFEMFYVCTMLYLCPQVVFMVPNYVKDVLLPLNAELETAMRDLGFLGWSFYSGLDIACDPVSSIHPEPYITLLYSNRGRVLIEACLIYKPGSMFKNRGPILTVYCTQIKAWSHL